MVNETVFTCSYSSASDENLLIQQNDDGCPTQSGSVKKIVSTMAELGVGKDSNSPNGERICLASRSTSISSTGSLLSPLMDTKTMSHMINSAEIPIDDANEVHNNEMSVLSGLAGIDISSMRLMKNLKAIVAGEGCWGKTLNCGLGCFYDVFDATTDEEWLDYLRRSADAIDRKAEIFWRRKPDLVRELIQQILFSTFRAVQRFDYVTRHMSYEHVTAIEMDIKFILKHYYCQFGASEFRKIFDYHTYPHSTNFIYGIRSCRFSNYDFDVVSKTLAEHFAQKRRKYLPDFVRRLMNATANQTLEDILELTEADRQRLVVNEQFNLTYPFVQRSLSKQLTHVPIMQGLENYGSTCFAATSVWPILCSPYSAYLGTDEAIGQTSENNQPLTTRQCLNQLGKETNKEKQVQLLQAGLSNCLSTLTSQYHQGMHQAMQTTYKLLLDFCIQGAIQGNFGGFESFDELLNKRLTHQKWTHGSSDEKSAESLASVVQARHLPQQDCAEFFAPLLQLVLPKESLYKCAFRVLTERQVMRMASIVTITDNPQLPTQATQDEQPADQAPPDTFIFSLPIAPELADRDDFSLQALLDEALSYQNVAHRQHRITVRQDSFRHAVQHFPLAADQANMKEEETEWDILRERQILLVNEAPKVITIQPKMPPEFRQRAAIAKRLACDQGRELTLTFRKLSTDKALSPEIIRHSYRVCAKVFYVEDAMTGARHYRCTINDEKKGELLIDDLNVYQFDGGTRDYTKCGILCLMVLEQTAS